VCASTEAHFTFSVHAFIPQKVEVYWAYLFIFFFANTEKELLGWEVGGPGISSVTAQPLAAVNVCYAQFTMLPVCAVSFILLFVCLLLYWGLNLGHIP
jgi:hypothetical protein